jgi:hypothetical protein
MATKLVHNVATGEISEVELTAVEIAQHTKDKADSVAELQAQSTKLEQKAALLERLGITADEAALLLG